MREGLPRITIALTFDPDALSEGVRLGAPPAAMYRGEFGIRTGMPRILELLERERITGTWFITGHTATIFDAAVESILAGGHELGAHGWFHEDMAILSVPDQVSILSRSREALGRAIGAPPSGIRAPYWSVADQTLGLIEAAGFTYDSSLMLGDAYPFRVRLGDRHDLRGSSWGTAAGLIEVPVYSALSDWAHFEPDSSHDGLSAPSKVLEIWREEVLYAWEHCPGGIVTITMHPECIGRGHRMRMLEQFIAFVRTLDGAEFARIDEYLARAELVGSIGAGSSP